MTFKKLTLTSFPFLILVIGLTLFTALNSSNVNYSFVDALIECALFNTKFLVIWFTVNKVFMYLSFFKSRLIFLGLSCFYAITQASARIEAGEYLNISHLTLLFHSFHDSMLVTIGSFQLINLILICIIAIIIYCDHYFHKKHIYKNKALFILSLYLLSSMLFISVLSSFSQKNDYENTQFSGSLPSLSNTKINNTPNYNVLIFIFESLSWDYSSFSDEHDNTPHFKNLANDSVEFLNMNAYTPHSSKSIFSIICGSPPLLNRAILETSSNLEVTCLPELFKQHHYSPYFIQTATGTFESRARLVNTMGFDYFYAREDLRSKKIGYLSSDDSKLFDKYREKSNPSKPSDPFFLTLFTSSAHHPYAFSKNNRINSNNTSDFQRYLKLQKKADDTLGRIIKDLKQNNLYDNTLIIAVADHGEGFGINNIKQHDNNFYDEGVHVPAVIKFPAQFKIKPKLITEQFSLVDLSHYVIDQLNTNDPSYTLKNPSTFSHKKQNAVFMNCWYERKCFGWKEGELKTVVFPRTHSTKTYQEINNQKTVHLGEYKSTKEEIRKMEAEFLKYFNTDWIPQLNEVRFKNGNSSWHCPKNKACKFIKTR